MDSPESQDAQVRKDLSQKMYDPDKQEVTDYTIQCCLTHVRTRK